MTYQKLTWHVFHPTCCLLCIFDGALGSGHAILLRSIYTYEALPQRFKGEVVWSYTTKENNRSKQRARILKVSEASNCNRILYSIKKSGVPEILRNRNLGLHRNTWCCRAPDSRLGKPSGPKQARMRY